MVYFHTGVMRVPDEPVRNFHCSQISINHARTAAFVVRLSDFCMREETFAPLVSESVASKQTQTLKLLVGTGKGW